MQRTKYELKFEEEAATKRKVFANEMEDIVCKKQLLQASIDNFIKLSVSAIN